MSKRPSPPATAALPGTPLASMTAFARHDGTHGPWRFTWELRAVNGKGLDLRFKLPPNLDLPESELRALAGARLQRGSISANLSASCDSADVSIVVNEPALEALVRALRATAGRLGTAVPGLDALVGVKGIVEVREGQQDEAARNALVAALIGGFDAALVALCAMRAREGESLKGVLEGRLDAIEALIHAAERLPERSIDAIRARIAEQVRLLVESGTSLDPDRLHQEAVLIATKADVREELDRLTAHVAAARELIAKGGPVGRRLDFLAQEFNREANTLCSKSNAVALTQIGLDLKLLVDQFREQIQNIE